jgi:hypothetical protein
MRFVSTKRTLVAPHKFKCHFIFDKLMGVTIPYRLLIMYDCLFFTDLITFDAKIFALMPVFSHFILRCFKG